MATIIRPDDTIPKYRVIKQESKYYPQRKSWFGWKYFKNTAASIINYPDHETALSFIKAYIDVTYRRKPPKDYLVMEQLNSEGISIFKGEKNGN